MLSVTSLTPGLSHIIKLKTRHLKTTNINLHCFTYNLTTLSKPKSQQVSTNEGNIFNAAVPTSFELKTNANYYVIILSIINKYTRCLLHAGYQI